MDTWVDFSPASVKILAKGLCDILLLNVEKDFFSVEQCSSQRLLSQY